MIKTLRQIPLQHKVLASVLFVACFVAFGAQGAKVHAVTAANWQAGHIIDDDVFFDHSSMSAQDIQVFLNSKVPTCDTNGTQLTTRWNAAAGRYYTRAEWGASVGNPAPYTCLKDYVENPTTHANNFHSPGTSVPGGISAAQIIWNSAQTYGISPKVLLVTLQKEQGLVTDDWPYQTEYIHAMGANCPDTPAGCDPAYSGFATQTDRAGYLFNYYRNHITEFNFNVGSNFILWNVQSTGCGGSTVNIQNIATAMLYIYTPYQPNAASVSAFPGQGDGCSSYGNRNFWYYFNNWFGDSYTPSYAWSWQGQNLYTDATQTVGIDPYSQTLSPGERYYAVVHAKNVGTATWTQGATKLGMTNPLNFLSPVCDSTWASCGRPATLTEASVAPGGMGTFAFWVKMPPKQNATFTASMNLLQENVAWFNDPGMHYVFTLGSYGWSWQGQSLYTDATKATAIDSYNQPVSSSQRYYAVLKAKNTGTSTWYKGNFKLGTTVPLNNSSPVCDSTWANCGRPATLTEASVAPGAIGTFEFWVKMPPLASRSILPYFNLLEENVAWLNDPGMHYVFNLGTYSWLYQGQNLYTDAAQTTAIDAYAQTLAPNTRYYAVLKAKNTGTATWYKGDFKLGTTRPLNSMSAVCDSTWLNCGRPATLTEDSVAPGAIGTFAFWIKTPAAAGTQTAPYFNLLQENVLWLNDPGMHYVFKT